LGVQGLLVRARQPLNKDESEGKKKKDRGRGRRDNLRATHPPSPLEKRNAGLTMISSLTFLHEAYVVVFKLLLCISKKTR